MWKNVWQREQQGQRGRECGELSRSKTITAAVEQSMGRAIKDCSGKVAKDELMEKLQISITILNCIYSQCQKKSFQHFKTWSDKNRFMFSVGLSSFRGQSVEGLNGIMRPTGTGLSIISWLLQTHPLPDLNGSLEDDFSILCW